MTPTYRTILAKALADLDAHDKETQDALASRVNHPFGYWEARSDKRVDMQCRVVEAARNLLKEMDALEALEASRTEEDES